MSVATIDEVRTYWVGTPEDHLTVLVKPGGKFDVRGGRRAYWGMHVKAANGENGLSAAFMKLRLDLGPDLQEEVHWRLIQLPNGDQLLVAYPTKAMWDYRMGPTEHGAVTDFVQRTVAKLKSLPPKLVTRRTGRPAGG